MNKPQVRFVVMVNILAVLMSVGLNLIFLSRSRFAQVVVLVFVLVLVNGAILSGLRRAGEKAE